MRIKFAAYVNLQDLRQFFERKARMLQPNSTAIQVVDVVLRQAPILNFVKVGRSFFSQPREPIVLQDGMEMYNGFFQSAIMGWKPFLNVDVSHKAFPKHAPVLEIIAELCGPDLRDIRPLEKFMRNLKVEYEIPRNAASKRVYRVHGLGPPADRG